MINFDFLDHHLFNLWPNFIFHWFPSNSFYHSNGNGQPLILNDIEYLSNIFFIMRRNHKRTRGHKRSVFKYSLHVNNRQIDQNCCSVKVNNDWNLTEIQPSYLITEMFIHPKTHWNIKKNYYSNGNLFQRNICKGSLEIFLFVQIGNFLTDLRCILAVFKYKCLKIAAI